MPIYIHDNQDYNVESQSSKYSKYSKFDSYNEKRHLLQIKYFDKKLREQQIIKKAQSNFGENKTYIQTSAGLIPQFNFVYLNKEHAQDINIFNSMLSDTIPNDAGEFSQNNQAE